MIRLADYVTQFLVSHGVRDVFMVTGGGAMHLNDAIGQQNGLRYICCHHEQACAMAAEAYARLSNQIGVVSVTTGPGGINTLNGVFGAWTDSIPLWIISGQVKRETTLAHHSLTGHLRQLGDQETDIIGMVKGITKYAVTIDDPTTIRWHLEQAWHLARSGRPGPCWIDIPIDIQGTQIDVDQLIGFEPEETTTLSAESLATVCEEIHQRARNAKRPVILVGSGIRLAGMRDELIRLLDLWQVPIATAWNAHDTVWNDHPLYAGRPGSIGDRPGNFAVQNSDFLLVLGSRLNIRQVSYNWRSFARAAFQVIVDIDPAELAKPTLSPDLAVCEDLRTFLPALTACGSLPQSPDRAAWIDQCQSWRSRYPVLQPDYANDERGINPYAFVDFLFQNLRENEVVVCGDGTACVATFQGAKIQRNQRLFTNSGSASMGYDLPGAIGACFANDRQRVICIAGDGSIQMNLQELQTIVTHDLPIKIFLLNNGGYHSIRQTQQNFFPGNTVGCGLESGLGFPDFEKLAGAYGITYFRARKLADLHTELPAALAHPQASFCEIFLDLAQPFAPKLTSRRLADGTIVSPALEDMAPFLSEAELRENLFIPPANP